MSEPEAPSTSLTPEIARSMLRSISDYLAEHLDQPCSCNSCYVCAATLLVKLQTARNGPVINIAGWRTGMNKVGCTKLLHEFGLGIAEAFTITNQIVKTFQPDREPSRFEEEQDVIKITVSYGCDAEVVKAALREVGVIC
jgi:hypothetical protein